MCFPQSQSAADVSQTGHEWLPPSETASTNRPRKWPHFRLPVGSQERLDRLTAWGRRKLPVSVKRTVHTVHQVTLWVFNLRVSFAIFSLPLLLTGFLTVLSPHKDIQVCVGLGVLTIFLPFLLSSRERWIVVHRFLGRTRSSIDADGSEHRCSVRMKTYKVLPLNQLSRLWGAAADTELPRPFKYLSVWLFATLMKCDRSEAEYDSLSSYSTISQFFRRRLKPGSRPVCPVSPLVSPADGTLTYIGPVQGTYLEQVKGISYCIKQFLGGLEELVGLVHPSTGDTVPGHPLQEGGCRGQEEASGAELNEDLLSRDCTEVVREADDMPTQQKYSPFKSLESDARNVQQGNVQQGNVQQGNGSPPILSLIQEVRSGSRLYQAVVYLSPSDYHRFHSPAAWLIEKRRHFPGKLYSVSPAIVRRMPGLFHTNERVTLLGQWEHGFFSMTAVGATNVGSIVVNFDDGLTTNLGGQEFSERELGVRVDKGEEMGYFNFGSTIVLVFQAPRDYKFENDLMQRVRVGQPI